jgi:hypothetical protein
MTVHGRIVQMCRGHAQVQEQARIVHQGPAPGHSNARLTALGQHAVTLLGNALLEQARHVLLMGHAQERRAAKMTAHGEHVLIQHGRVQVR